MPTKEGKANIDGNPLYFAQATSDGNTRTDGSGNVKDRGSVDINIDRIKIEFEKVTNKIGEPVINSEKISLLNSMPEIEFNDKIFKQVIINKENYFVTEKDGRLIGIQFQTDGKILETQFEKKSKYLGFVTEYSPITQRIIDANNRYRPIEPSSEKYFNLKESILDNALNSKKKLSDKEWENLFKKISEQGNSDLSDFEKDYLNDTLKSLRSMSASDFNLIKAEYSNNKNTDLIGPRWRFDSIFKNQNDVKHLLIPHNEEVIPKGGRDITFENGVVIRERDWILDRDELINEGNRMIEHWIEQPHLILPENKNMTGSDAIGKDLNARFMIPKSGVDENGNVLWDSYSFHPADIIHRYTTKEMAEFSVSFATNWNKYQNDNNQITTPIKWNDFSMPGNGTSPLHHKNTYPFDMIIPSKNGQDIRFFDNRPGGILSKPTYDKMGNVNLNPNYDREKTIQMIKVIGESLLPGKIAEIRFNDPEVIKYFKGTNIKVIYSGGHDHHLDIRLKND